MKTKYKDWPKEELIKKITLLEKNRYGLVWEEKEEDVAVLCDKFLPVLHEIPNKEIKSNGNLPQNILIEGDNYHALYTLNFTHKRKIDVIYIDPPYNTGNKSWRYNNNYVEKEDPFKHSKWLSFMSKRLRLAKYLLKETGIIIVTIDDYEVSTLILLMNKIFGETNRLGTIVVVHNPRGRNDDKYFATMHEYMLVYARNSSLAQVGYFELTDEDKQAYKLRDDISSYNLTSFMRTGNNSDRITRPQLYYSIFYNPKKNNLDLKDDNNSIQLLPINSSGEEKTWRWGKETFLEKKDTELIVKKVKDNYRIFKKRRITNIIGKKPKTIWYDPRYDSSSHGIMVLQKIFHRKNVFPYPKSIWANIDILKIISNKNSTILDFFAGSGTIGHAVLELNKKDGGNRKFILCTNNENGICDEVCYPRIKKVIKGYNGNKAIKANLKYFKTEFVSQIVTDNDKRILVNRSTELLCLSENTFEFVKQSKRKLEYSIYKSDRQYTAIIYDEDAIEKCKFELLSINPKVKTVIYVFSYNHEYNSEDFEDLTINFNVKPIPEAILNVYRKNSKLRRK